MQVTSFLTVDRLTLLLPVWIDGTFQQDLQVIPFLWKSPHFMVPRCVDVQRNSGINLRKFMPDKIVPLYRAAISWTEIYFLKKKFTLYSTTLTLLRLGFRGLSKSRGGTIWSLLLSHDWQMVLRKCLDLKYEIFFNDFITFMHKCWMWAKL